MRECKRKKGPFYVAIFTGKSAYRSVSGMQFTDLFEWLFLGEVDHLLGSTATHGMHEDGSTLRPRHHKMVVGASCNTAHCRAMTLHVIIMGRSTRRNRLVSQ